MWDKNRDSPAKSISDDRPKACLNSVKAEGMLMAKRGNIFGSTSGNGAGV
jgi:hypothetical protein